MANKIKIRKVFDDYIWTWELDSEALPHYLCFPTWESAMAYADKIIQMQKDDQWSLGFGPIDYNEYAWSLETDRVQVNTDDGVVFKNNIIVTKSWVEQTPHPNLEFYHIHPFDD